MPSSSAPSTCNTFTFAPVASSAFSKRTSSLFESVATRSPASSFITLVSVSTSTSLSSYQLDGRKRMSSLDSSPRTYFFESGGRL
jgi:hypothetical protein